MKISRKKPLNANVGVIGVGLDTYWEQFDGLYDVMLSKMKAFNSKLKKHSVTVFDFGMVDNADKAYEVLPALKSADLDLLFIDMVTYATSATFGVIARDLNIPIILVALQPLNAMDYINANTFMQLCNDDYCSVPEFTGVAVRMGRKAPPIILGTLENDDQVNTEISEWCSIANVLHDLKRARIGHMGHVLEAMTCIPTLLR